MGIDRRHVPGRFEGRIELQSSGAIVGPFRTITQRLGLPRHELSARVLANLHRVATHETENSIRRLTLHRLGNFVPVDRISAVS
jgi:hypothetical protein